MIEWLINNPIVTGLITVLLSWSDWLLTIAQEKERKVHYYEHYQSYPINTIEGHFAFQNEVTKQQLINPKHFTFAVIIGIIAGFSLTIIPKEFREIFIGYIWGLYLIVDTQHLNNLLGYRASRKGIHGKLWMHQRTGFLIQSGRYTSIALFLLLISILSGSQIIYGITIAGFVSALRQLIWLRKVPPIDEKDLPPEKEYPKND